MSNKLETKSNISFRLRGGLYTLTTIQLIDQDLDAFSEQLKEKIQQAPNFFRCAPTILDLKSPNGGQVQVDLQKVSKIISQANLVLVGIKNSTPQQKLQAEKFNLAVINESTMPEEKQEIIKSNVDTEVTPGKKAKLVTEIVRSGQQIYAPEGDLIIMSPVSQGAELLADGNIHVYGPLRGRALAGINGDIEARIFCQSLEAELISIAGRYKISEDIEKQAWKIPASIWVEDNSLKISNLRV